MERLAFSPEDLAARRWLAEKMSEEAGLVVRTDGLGSTIGSSASTGGGAGAAALLLGSHSDVPAHGRWLDGALGVVYALEAARALREAGCPGLWAVVDWSGGSGRSQPSQLLGSAVFAGLLEVEGLPELDELRAQRGLLGRPVFRAGDEGVGPFWGYFEAHVERGRRLLDGEVALASAPSIAGVFQYELIFSGRHDRVGSTPMALRKDAGIGAMRFAMALDIRLLNLCREQATAVWTFGHVRLDPNEAGTVPGGASLTVEIRDVDSEFMELMDDAVRDVVVKVNGERGVFVRLGSRTVLPVAELSGGLRETLEGTLEGRVPSNWTGLPAGVVHDASMLSTAMPTALLLLRDHRVEDTEAPEGAPLAVDEEAEREDVALGARMYVEAAGAMVAAAAAGETCAAA